MRASHLSAIGFLLVGCLVSCAEGTSKATDASFGGDLRPLDSSDGSSDLTTADLGADDLEVLDILDILDVPADQPAELSDTADLDADEVDEELVVLESCGDGTLDANEECDQGANNSDLRPDACRTNCHLAGCGDGIIDTGEECDARNQNSDTAPNACRLSCQKAFCGDGILDTGEVCDEAGANSDTAADACRTTCQEARCGDGVVDNGETCDDGDLIDQNTCGNQCVEVSAALCRTCAVDADCGRTSDRCVTLPEGRACAIACSSGTDCPTGYDCAPPTDGGSTQCLPSSGTCAGCFDPDGDQYGVGNACLGLDCDETRATVNEGATEFCDGEDNDCDFGIDEGLKGQYWPDTDADGFGDENVTPIQTCAPEAGWVTNGDDCDDMLFAIKPGAVEVCDGADNNCDHQSDEGLELDYWPDGDADGYGNKNVSPTNTCAPQSGWVTNGTDCDDTLFSDKPGGTEACDNRDNNCNNQVDEGLKQDYWPDGDADGYGDTNVTPTNTCAPQSGWVTNGSDCDDTVFAIKPGAVEVCDNVDNNCDTQVDEGLVQSYWPDVDLDGYGAQNATPTITCTPQGGWVTNGTDCDDNASAIKPNATETCDGRDNDCDSVVDDGAGCPCNQSQWGGHSYLLCPTPTAWSAAQTACAAVGYSLVAVGSSAENDHARNRANAVTFCTYTCSYDGDGECDDGGPNSDWSVCAYGTDCTDCGTRGIARLWLGLNDVSVEGTFVWAGGDPSSYRNWASGEPNNSGDEDCAELIVSPGNWNDNQCANTLPYLCESP